MDILLAKKTGEEFGYPDRDLVGTTNNSLIRIHPCPWVFSYGKSATEPRVNSKVFDEERDAGTSLSETGS